MKRTTIIMALPFLMLMQLYGQKITLDLTFSGIDGDRYQRLDSVKILNRTQGEVYRVYWPDTTLAVEITAGDTLLNIGYAPEFPVGIPKELYTGSSFRLSPVHPNPVETESMVSLYIPDDGMVGVSLIDPMGRVSVSTERLLEKGTHQFRITPMERGLFIVTATWNGLSRSRKAIASEHHLTHAVSIEYMGSHEGETTEPNLKEVLVESFRESGILDTPSASKTYLFQFGCNMPCPGIPTVVYEGQTYHTIQIFSQCWLKENLNVGNRIPVSLDMSDNGILEKYCYDDNPDYCLLYGGLYQWEEAMQYSTQQGTEGICPPGWHIPTDEEWKVLEGMVDSQNGIGDSSWDWPGFRGHDAGKNLKSVSGWHNDGNGVDLFGFTGLPGGRSAPNGYFYDLAYDAFWWTSTEQSATTEWKRDLSWGSNYSGRQGGGYRDGYSIRCIKN